MATARAISRLQARLQALTTESADFWAFKDDSDRDLAHSLFQYPAMMVPRLQRTLLDEILQADETSRSIYDPFIGSGTVMTEAMLRGLDVGGVDVNPLAVLVCRTKAGPYHHECFASEARAVASEASADRATRVEAAFPGLEKWFQPLAIQELSKLRRAIAKRADLSARRFLWVALAETVRLTSNSRTSTVKLHVRSLDDLKRRAGHSPIEVFVTVARKNAQSLKDQVNLLTERKLASSGHYRAEVSVQVGDARQPPERLRNTYDIVMTSPPYGDNQTTVTYGQHSYLPLQWIDLADIDDGLDTEFLRTTHEIDARGLGGTTKQALTRVASLEEQSPSLRAILDTLRPLPTDGAKRVGAFVADLELSLDPILRRLKRNGLMLWIVGDRRVNGVTVPTTDILTELFGDRVELAANIDRPIKRKRHAHRNSVAATMTHEAILVYRKLRNDA